MKLFSKILIFLLVICSLSACQKDGSASIKIGVVIPIEHAAMQEIVAGFTETLHSLYHQPVTIKVKNAHNDINIQRAIIQQMRDENINIIVPIGTDVTQMTRAIIHDQPIVSLAADFSEEQRQKLIPCNIAVVHDKIPLQQLISFIHRAYPHLKNITLIHSTSDKVVPDVNEAIAAGKINAITITPIMAAALADLTGVTQSLPANTEAILILKDNLMVSGISTLIKTATERHILLITSDQLSVQNGAGFSLGAPEREIGVAGAKLAIALLEGKSACALPIVEMKNLTVFINQPALKKAAQDFLPIINAAKQFGFAINFTDRKEGKK